MVKKIKTSNVLFLCFFMFISLDIISPSKLKENTILRKFMSTQVTNSTILSDSILINYFADGQCSDTNCKAPFGTCSTSNQCKCSQGWIQSPFRNVSTAENSCDYQLKKQVWFFSLEFLSWIGIGHMYASRFLYGIIKCSVMFLILFMDFVIIYDKTRAPKCLNYFIHFIYFSFFVWHTYDLVMIGTNLYLDGNGMPISNWQS